MWPWLLRDRLAFSRWNDCNPDVHGNRVPSDGTTTMFSFDGRSFDPAAGLQWNVARHFDPTVGQWMSEDPIGHVGDDENLRRYIGEWLDDIDPLTAASHFQQSSESYSYDTNGNRWGLQSRLGSTYVSAVTPNNQALSDGTYV